WATTSISRALQSRERTAGVSPSARARSCRRKNDEGRLAPPLVYSLVAARAAVAAAATPASAVAAAPTLLALLTRRRVLRPLDQLLGRHDAAVLVLRDQLEADPAALLVDLLHEHVEDVATVDHVLDVADAARADVGDVQQ